MFTLARSHINTNTPNRPLSAALRRLIKLIEILPGIRDVGRPLKLANPGAAWRNLKGVGRNTHLVNKQELKYDREYADLKIDKWQIVVTTSPARRDIPRQRWRHHIAQSARQHP